MSLPEIDPAEAEFRLFWFEDQLPERLASFTSQAATRGHQLDYSLDSLAALEKYVVARQWHPDQDNADAVNFGVDCWSYLGEVLRSAYGGAWQVSVSEQNSANRGLLVVEGHGAAGVEFVPARALNLFARQPRPGLLRQLVVAQRAEQQLPRQAE